MNIEILNYNFLENSVLDYLVTIGVFFLALAVLKIFKFTVLRKLKKIAKQTSVRFDDILIEFIDTIGWPLYFFFSIYIAIQFIQFPDIIGRVISVVILVILIYYIVKAIQQLIDFGFGKVVEKKQKEEEFDPVIINLSKRLLKRGFMDICCYYNFTKSWL